MENHAYDDDLDNLLYDNGLTQGPPTNQQDAGYNKKVPFNLVPMHSNTDAFSKINIKDTPSGGLEIEAVYGDANLAAVYYEHERQMASLSQKAMLDEYQMQLGYMQSVVQQQNQYMFAMQQQFQFILDMKEAYNDQRRIEMQEGVAKMAMKLVDAHRELMELRRAIINILPPGKARNELERYVILSGREIAPDANMELLTNMQDDESITTFEVPDDSIPQRIGDRVQVQITDTTSTMDDLSLQDTDNEDILYEEDYDASNTGPMIIEDLVENTITVEIPRRKSMTDTQVAVEDTLELEIPYNSAILGVELQAVTPVVTTIPIGQSHTIPRNDGASMRQYPHGKPYVDYTKKRHTAIEHFDVLTTDSLIQNTSEKSLIATGVDQLDVFTHYVNTSKFTVANPNDRKGGLYWEAFDIPFNGKWKKICALQLKGLTQARFAIVRIISKARTYVTLYSNLSTYSKYFDAMAIDKANRGEDASRLTLAYDAVCDHPTYGHIVSALAYAYAMNNQTQFTICEQSANFRKTEQFAFLSKDYPGTEIRDEYSVFSGVENMVISTNVPNTSFDCYYEDKKFIIQYTSYL
jgi:hypothetical protein